MRARTTAAAVVFVVAFFAFAFLFLRMSILWDADSYYHLAVARHYVQHGLFTPIPWARFSMLANGADKELLFHVALMPFATLLDPAVGGRIALALLNATLFTLVGYFCSRALGPAGFAVPLAVWVAAPPFFTRVVRLRPELGALLIILIAIPVVAKRRWIALGVLAMFFTYTYTAFHVFLAICVIWLLVQRAAPRDMVPVVVGTLIGLFARPFPFANLQLWFVQNVAYFFNKARLDVGAEIRPPSLHIALEAAGWLLMLLLICRPKPSRDPFGTVAAVPALVFAILFVGIGRMATYVFPLATIVLVLLFAQRTRIVPIAIAVGTLIGMPLAANEPLLQSLARSGLPEVDWRAFGNAVPCDAKVAARWSDAELYAFWAPQGRYLNVLDPLFMARPHPREYAVQRAIFDGSHPDIPGAAKQDLDSDFIAFDWGYAPRELKERIKGDPRVRALHGGNNVLLQFVPAPVTFTSARSQECTTFDRFADGPRRFRFAPYGAGGVEIDGRVVATTQGTRAVLSRAIPVDVPAGRHRVTIRSCGASGYNGFYFTDLQ